MKPKIFFIAIIIFFAPLASRAQEINLGDFSTDQIQKVTDTPIFFHFADQKFAVEKNSLLGWLKIRPALNVEKNYRSEAENINYSPTTDPKLQIYFRFLTRVEDRYHIKISNGLSLDEDNLKNYLSKAKDDTHVAPVDARFSFSDGKASAFSLSKNGSEINVEKSLSNVENILKQNAFIKDINLETSILKPEVASTDMDKYGIKELIGEGVSNFRGSPKNRIHNINVGAARFNGVLIKPSEEFSFIKTLGPVDASTGYLPELVIKTDKTVPEFGGGMRKRRRVQFSGREWKG